MFAAAVAGSGGALESHEKRLAVPTQVGLPTPCVMPPRHPTPSRTSRRRETFIERL
jgi:hypothetical protein